MATLYGFDIRGHELTQVTSNECSTMQLLDKSITEGTAFEGAPGHNICWVAGSPCLDLNIGKVHIGEVHLGAEQVGKHRGVNRTQIDTLENDTTEFRTN
jgi:hypothetical protein